MGSSRIRAGVFALAMLSGSAGAAGRSGSSTPNASPPAVDSLTAAQRSSLDDFVRRSMAELRLVPGLALSVVIHDRIVYERGYGLADVATGRAVTPGTVFYTASLAKAFTGMTASVMAARGRLDLDAPLRRFFPGLTSEAPVRGDSVTVRDLLRHEKGFTNGAVNFRTTFVGPMSEEELVRVLNGYSSPASGFVYSNTDYALASDVITAASGRSWREEMDRLVFEPLGMRRSTAWASRVDTARFARSYRATAAGFRPLEFPKTDGTITGAGGIFSTAHDLAAFVIANLNDGRHDGRQALPAAAVREAHRPQAGLDATFFEYHRFAYGLGFYLARWQGDLLIHHFGGYPGYRSHLSFMPERGIGVVVLQNEGLDGSHYADIVASYVYDLLLGRDAEGNAAKRIEKLRADVARRRAKRSAWLGDLRRLEREPAPVARPLADYAGTYRNERLGALRLAPAGGGLRLEWGDLHGAAIPAGADSFQVDWIVNWLSSHAPARFVFTSDGGAVTGFDWGGRPFRREGDGGR